MRMICDYCGGDNVTRDALAGWCAESQSWVLVAVLQNADCADCDNQTHLSEVEAGQ